MITNHENFNKGVICITGNQESKLWRYVKSNEEREAIKWIDCLKGIYGDYLFIELVYHENVEEKIVVDLDLNESTENPEDFINNVIEENTLSHEKENYQQENESIEFDIPHQTEKLDNDFNISNTQSMRIEAREREERLREISIKLRTPSGLTKLEEEPAYKRNKVDLEETIHSSEDEVSHFSLEEKDDNILLNDNNSYLHDNVD